MFKRCSHSLGTDHTFWRCHGSALMCVIAISWPYGLVASGPEPVVQDMDPTRAVPETERVTWALTDSASAINFCGIIVQNRASNHPATTAKLVRIVRDNTPFLNARIEAAYVWQVTLRDFGILLRFDGADLHDAHSRILDIFIDARTAQLLKIVSRWPASAAPMPPEPPADLYSAQLLQSGNEVYHGFPSEAPGVSFIDALASLLKGAANPLEAEQIVGQYVMWSRVGYSRRRVWVITIRGDEALWHSFHHEVPIASRNHMRYIVDAQTGSYLCGSSTPRLMRDGGTQGGAEDEEQAAIGDKSK